jgi:hypothetical protein
MILIPEVTERAKARTLVHKLLKVLFIPSGRHGRYHDNDFAFAIAPPANLQAIPMTLFFPV